ncbi:MAG TPA: type VI secretion system tube protein Hcp [Verrucomicrobiae bacterium]
MKCILLLAAILSFTLPNRAAVDIFLKITEIPGESTDAVHKDEIDISSYSFGMSNSTTIGGAGTGRVTFKDISLTKRVDKSSPLLMLDCAKGQRIPEAIITLAKSGADKPIDFLRITLTDAFVTSVASSAAAGDDSPTESVSFNFAKIKFEYYQQHPDGSVTLAGTFGWDVVGAKQL